jgi:hypothetical protein
MRFEADLTVTGLREPDEFGAFEVVAARQSHLWITPEQIRELAGTHADDPSWQAGFERMLAYAQAHGWVNDEGAVRAHVEWS